MQTYAILGIIAGVAIAGFVGGFLLITQVPGAQETLIKTVTANPARGPSEEEKLAADKQALEDRKAYLGFRENCAFKQIDDLKCESLWAEKKSIEAAEKEIKAHEDEIAAQK